MPRMPIRLPACSPGLRPLPAAWPWLAVMVLMMAMALGRPVQAADTTITVRKSGSELRQVTARYAIAAPPAFVWQTITSYPQLPSFIPSYRRCQVIRHQGNEKTLDVQMQASRLLPHFRYQVRVRENPKALNLSLSRISGDFSAFNGEYHLYPSDNGASTVLVYTLSIDTGMPLPGASAMIKANVERELSAVRAHAEQAHRKSLIGAN